MGSYTSYCQIGKFLNNGDNLSSYLPKFGRQRFGTPIWHQIIKLFINFIKIIVECCFINSFEFCINWREYFQVVLDKD